MRNGNGGFELERRYVDRDFGTIGGKDFNHDPNPEIEAKYNELREKARAEDKIKGNYFGRSRAAYERGDGARAKQLSNKGKEHAAKSDEFDAQASNLIFRANNKNFDPDIIDLHGLFVHEAVAKVKARIEANQNNGLTHLHVIVGKGVHSVGHIQKLKPAIEELCQDLGLRYETEENEGRILVNLPPRPQQNHYDDQHVHYGEPHGGQYHGNQNQQEEPYDEIERLVTKLFKKLCCTVM